MFKKFKRKLNEYNGNIRYYGEFDSLNNDGLFWVLSSIVPSFIIIFLEGIFKEKKYALDDLRKEGLLLGCIKTGAYAYIFMVAVLTYLSVNPDSLHILWESLLNHKVILFWLVSDNALTSWLTVPLSYLLGRDAKKGVSKIKTKIQDSKDKKELLLEQKKELEKELAKDYLVSPEVMEYTNSSRRKEIEDYKKLREEYAPTIPTEVVSQNDKVLGLK